ncbi:MAG: hypothetical protein WAV15_00980 [Minisyncoccia bacterium]
MGLEVTKEAARIPEIPELSMMDFELPELSEKNRKNSKSYSAIFNGEVMSVQVSNDLSLDEGVVHDMAITISHPRSGSGAKIFISVERKPYGYLGTTDVNNYEYKFQNPRFLKGAARTLWEISTGIMQKYANLLTAPVKHVVSKTPNYDLGMTNEKWDELMLPLFDKYGYERVDEYLWEKTYNPKEQ